MPSNWSCFVVVIFSTLKLWRSVDSRTLNVFCSKRLPIRWCEGWQFIQSWRSWMSIRRHICACSASNHPSGAYRCEPSSSSSSSIRHVKLWIQQSCTGTTAANRVSGSEDAVWNPATSIHHTKQVLETCSTAPYIRAEKEIFSTNFQRFPHNYSFW